MSRTRPKAAGVAVVALVLTVSGAGARGQAPPVPSTGAARVRESTSLGPVPGSGGSRGGAPANVGTVISGRPGPTVPRVTSGITQPGPGVGRRPTQGITVPPTPPLSELPIYGPLSIPSGPEDEGPHDGLTLDAAIARLLAGNLDLRAQFHEISKADADILTASLRANPIFYADSQLIPYGNYSDRRPGGQTQYDVNVTYPLDVSHKRQARTAVACQAKRVIEAQFQDAVRRKIDSLYAAYVSILGARETTRYAETSVSGLEQLLEKTERLRQGGERTRADVDRVQIQLNSARIGLLDAEVALRNARRELAPLLGIPPADAERIEVRGAIADTAPPPPPPDALVGLAKANRPDLAALRLGIGLARADVRLAEREKYQDVFLLYQPYTFQDNQPFNRLSSHSWALGVTVPVPIYNRNQGNIRRAHTNVAQTITQLAAAELQIATDVEQAEREYAVTRAAVARIEQALLPEARRIRDETLLRYNQGEAALIDFLIAQREYNDLVRQYRDTQVRHRRSMLALNTAVGVRLLP